MELFLRMVGEGKLPNKQTINILMELLDEAGQFSKVGVPMFMPMCMSMPMSIFVQGVDFPSSVALATYRARKLPALAACLCASLTIHSQVLFQVLGRAGPYMSGSTSLVFLFTPRLPQPPPPAFRRPPILRFLHSRCRCRLSTFTRQYLRDSRRRTGTRRTGMRSTCTATLRRWQRRPFGRACRGSCRGSSWLVSTTK